MTNKLSIKVFTIGLALLAIGGCKKVLNPEPIGQQTIDANFTNFNGALTAVNGIYAQLSNGNLYRGSNVLMNVDQASDDVMDDSRTVVNYSVIDYFELVPDNAVTFQLWDELYRIIYRSNVVLGRVPAINFPAGQQNNGSGTSFKNQFLGEAQFLRAFAYFNLVRLFGDVPLRTTEITSAGEVNIPRSPAADVYRQIEADLMAAAQNLPSTYSGNGSGNEKGRVTRWAALLMLADAYLTQKKYAEAKATALQVIQNTGGLRLLNNYNDIFPARNGGNENTAESLFEIQFSANNQATGTSPVGNNYGFIMGPLNDANGGVVSLGRYRPTDNASPDNEAGFTGGLIQEYDADDLRLTVNFHQAMGSNNLTRWLTRKWYEQGRGSVGAGNFMVYRFAEALLIYAEATNELGGPDAQAIDYINQLRRRAFGLPLNVTSAKDIAAGQTQATFRDIVRSERRKELALENKRWFDLVRYGFTYANDVLKVKQKRDNFAPFRLLFPIARIETINNPQLTQNPGYN